MHALDDADGARDGVPEAVGPAEAGDRPNTRARSTMERRGDICSECDLLVMEVPAALIPT